MAYPVEYPELFTQAAMGRDFRIPFEDSKLLRAERAKMHNFLNRERRNNPGAIFLQRPDGTPVKLRILTDGRDLVVTLKRDVTSSKKIREVLDSSIVSEQ